MAEKWAQKLHFFTRFCFAGTGQNKHDKHQRTRRGEPCQSARFEYFFSNYSSQNLRKCRILNFLTKKRTSIRRRTIILVLRRNNSFNPSTWIACNRKNLSQTLPPPAITTSTKIIRMQKLQNILEAQDATKNLLLTPCEKIIQKFGASQFRSIYCTKLSICLLAIF
jgi:hypothetical protein